MEEKFMKEAIKEAKKALQINEMPIGAIIVYENKIIGRGYNKKEKYKDATMHAEIIAIKKACKHMKDWRLNKCSIYVTMEPCSMCMGAIIESRIENIIYGVENEKSNSSNQQLITNNKINIKSNISTEKIQQMMKIFFNSIRNR